MPRCTNRANRNSNYNNISHNNDAIVTLSRYIENPGIVWTVYSGIFRDIQQYSGIIEAYGAIIRHVQNSV